MILALAHPYIPAHSSPARPSTPASRYLVEKCKLDWCHGLMLWRANCQKTADNDLQGLWLIHSTTKLTNKGYLVKILCWWLSRFLLYLKCYYIRSLSISDNLCWSAGEQKISALVLVNLSAIFDTIDHNRFPNFHPSYIGVRRDALSSPSIFTANYSIAYFY